MSERRGFFARIGAFFGAPDPSELRPEWKPPPPSTPGAAPSPAATRGPDAVAASARAPAASPASQEAPPPIPRGAVRPPGALPEREFLAACTRCGKCVEACPPEAIVKGLDGFPRLEPAATPCALCATVPCAAACPAEVGALVPIAPDAIRVGFARVFDKLCLNHHEAESCDNCLDWCPVPGALGKGPRGIPTVDLARCTGCGLCARRCKSYPVAIGIRPR